MKHYIFYFIVLSIGIFSNKISFAVIRPIDQELRQAVLDRDLTKAAKLIAKGANVNMTNGEGPLEIAVVTDYYDMVFLLLKHNAQVTNAVISELLQGDPVIDKLVKEYLVAKARKALINTPDANGFLPIHKAAVKAKVIALDALIAAGVDVNGVTAAGNTALHLVSQLPNLAPVAEHLLDRGANINAQNLSGSTPLHLAVKKQLIPTIELLINRKANVNIENEDGNTVLDLARETGNERLIALIQKAGGRSGGSSLLMRYLSNLDGNLKSLNTGMRSTIKQKTTEIQKRKKVIARRTKGKSSR